MREWYRLKSPLCITIECDVPTPNGRCVPWCDAGTVEEKANCASAQNDDVKDSNGVCDRKQGWCPNDERSLRLSGVGGIKKQPSWHGDDYDLEGRPWAERLYADLTGRGRDAQMAYVAAGGDGGQGA